MLGHWVAAFSITSPDHSFFKDSSPITAMLQQDNDFMLLGKYDGLYGFDGISVKKVSLNPDQPVVDVRVIKTMSSDRVLIGTRGQGVFVLNEHLQVINQYSTIRSIGKKINEDVHSIAVVDDDIWLGTEDGLFQIDVAKNSHHHPIRVGQQYKQTQVITEVVYINNQFLALGTTKGLYLFNLKNHEFSSVNAPELAEAFVFSLATTTDSLWVGVNQGLVQVDLASHQVSRFQPELINTRVISIVAHEKNLWLGSLTTGLIHIELNSEKSVTFYNKKINENSIKHTTVWSLYLDNHQHLWISTFDKGAYLLDISTKDFITAKMKNQDSDCFSNALTTAFFETNHQEVLIAQANAVLKFDYANHVCDIYNLSDDGIFAFGDNRPSAIASKSEYQFWIGTSRGIKILDLNTASIRPLNTQLDNLSVTFIHQITAFKYLIGTHFGLYELNVETAENQTIQLGTNKDLKDINYYQAFTRNDGSVLLKTHAGLALYHQSGKVSRNDVFNKQIDDKSTIEVLFVDELDQVHLVTANKNIWIFNASDQLVKHIPLNINKSEFSILSFLKDESGVYWVGTNHGLIRLQNDNEISLFTQQNGLAGNYFSVNAAARLKPGWIMFGSKGGYEYFNPNKITHENKSTALQLTNLYRFNKPVIPTDKGSLIDRHINQVSTLALSHEDYVTSIEFNVMDYLNHDRYEYSYQLEGFDPDWSVTDIQKVTYTNLPANDYRFTVRSTDKFNIIPASFKQINIHVSPPPWLTWWAYLSYILIVVFGIYWYIKRKIKTNQLIANRLRIEVAEKTKELKVQKQTVEDLLVKKNELFSNVSHEFRTPLTLILGPLKALLKKQYDIEDISSLKMINRNANRLLSLVEQLLQLSRVSDLTKVKRTTQQTDEQIQAVVDSFQHIAKAKKITLKLIQNDAANINVTDQCIDAVLGNLVSNAIKYTQISGYVSVSAVTTKTQLILSIKDTGAGLTEIERREIFKRFKRLESHQNLEGIGIGLSVVEEVVKINNGNIEVKSVLGVGSEFIITFPLVEKVAVKKPTQISSLIKQLNSEVTTTLPRNDNTVTTSSTSANLNTVLVIEDNQDMRNHIIDIIGSHYHCLSANDGRAGVSHAIEHIPDIIISDIMMPEMDGFKVSRVIRSDQRTSHIPLILLTALSDKVSRIKGWRENVDAYMTKPFDRDELLIQIENMLTIRDILKSKAGESLKNGENTSLPKKDKIFIEKLTDLIHNNYQNPMLSRSKLADAMAVSDRQLQRKVKALIDQNPNDMLREHRLKKACEFLKDGYQVSQVADDCGFNSLSYFSQCFKAQFGMSPKQYQSKI